MTIESLPGPADASALLGGAIKHFISRQTPSALSSMDPGAAPQATRPMRVYLVGLQDALDSSAILQKAHPCGWRYLLLVADRAVAAADLREDTRGRITFNRLIGVQYAQRLASTTSAANDQYGNDQERFEPRILQIPVLARSALWLHGSYRDPLFPIIKGARSEVTEISEDTGFLVKLSRHAARRTIARIAPPP